MSDRENVTSSNGDLVVVGSSAGGIEALSILVSTLSTDFPAPIVLAQHLDPNRPSRLDTILQRRTALTVEVIHDRTILQTGKIYVVPANRHVSVVDGCVEIQGINPKRPRPSVDLLLSSAAEVYGERLIAVILTGSGSDGAAGAIEVKNLGGTVIVQDPQTARYPSMPLALPPTVVDFEVEIEQIGPLLSDLLTGVNTRLPEEKTEDVLRNILEQVSRQASIDFRPYKTTTILRRIGRRMTITHNRTMSDYLEYLKTHPEEVGELVKAFLINVTQFFRDAEAFTYLRREILPDFIVKGRARDRVLRFWAAGCATGEEPYSLAMLITEMLGEELSDWSVKIFATDLDEAAISFARRGVYTENLLKGLPAEYSSRFFEHTEHGYRIAKALRQMVIFGQQDLSRSAPFPRIDLVLCRNVLIYFTPELQDYVLNQFAFSLSPGGYLFLGKAETVRPNQSYYELVNKHWKVYHCTGNALPRVGRPGLPDTRMQRVDGHTFNHPGKTVGKHSPDQELPPPLELGQLRRFNELLLRFLPTGVAVIDRSYHLLTANGAARRLLGLREIGSDQDFLHAVRGVPYAEVRTAIDAVFRERTTVTLPEVELDIPAGGNGRFITLSIAPMQMESGTSDLAAVSVTDVTEQVQTRRQLEAVQAEQNQLMNALGSANKRLNDVNKELLDSNEELQVANEELVLTHEELQASIEELETNNEELQATNEELETTNEELRERTSELQELAAVLESERVRLVEMVELGPYYIVVLRGPGLVVEAFNPRYAQFFEGQLVQGRPLQEIFEAFWEPGLALVRLALEAYYQDSVRIIPRMPTRLPDTGSDAAESYFTYTIVPSHDARGKVSGVIIYATDETEQRAHEAEEEREKLKLIFDNADLTALALYDAQTAELLMATPRYLEKTAGIHHLDADKLLGRGWYELTMVPPDQNPSRIWNTVLESRAPYRLPELHLNARQHGAETVWNWSLTPIMETEKPDIVRFMLVSAIEITQQTRAREEMERLNRLKDEFLSLASHELRTPLSSILGNAQLLQQDLKRQMQTTSKDESGKTTTQSLDQQESNTLDRIISQARRMNKLIDEMLDITRIRSEVFELKKQEHVDIVALVRLVVEDYAASSDHPISLETSLKSLAITCDEARVEQVLNNLMGNAIKYSPPGKPVVAGIEQGQSNEVIVWVRDQGPGISQEEQAHIFDRFYRAHAYGNPGVEGLGLGLYIAHEIVNRHGGRMWLASKPEAGSTFYFSLPLT